MARKENPLKKARGKVDDIDTIIFDSIGGPGAPGMTAREFLNIMFRRDQRLFNRMRKQKPKGKKK